MVPHLKNALQLNKSILRKDSADYFFHKYDMCQTFLLVSSRIHDQHSFPLGKGRIEWAKSKQAGPLTSNPRITLSISDLPCPAGPNRATLKCTIATSSFGVPQPRITERENIPSECNANILTTNKTLVNILEEAQQIAFT